MNEYEGIIYTETKLTPYRRRVCCDECNKELRYDGSEASKH